MIEDASVFVPASRIAYRRIGDQVVLVAPDDNVLLTLNTTGSAVWEGLDAGQSVVEIAATLEQEFAVSADQALQDVVAFVELMLERALVERVTADRET